jgi:hypothetical protein
MKLTICRDSETEASSILPTKQKVIDYLQGQERRDQLSASAQTKNNYLQGQGVRDQLSTPFLLASPSPPPGHCPAVQLSTHASTASLTAFPASKTAW